MSVKTAARRIAEAYGRRLGLLLLTLNSAEKETRRARPSWNDEHWRFWQNISTVHIGGGLLSGAVGPIAITCAQESLRNGGLREMTIQISPYGAYLPIAGIARVAPPQASAILAFDFGHSDIKRAALFYNSGSITELRLMPNKSAGLTSQHIEGSEREQAQAVADNLVSSVTASWRDAIDKGWPLDPVICISLACYLINGHPPPSEHGTYGRIQLLTDNMQLYFAARIGEVVGRKIRIILMHDGSAAGLVYAGLSQTVAVMLGTYLGVGIPPDNDQGLRENKIEQTNWHRPFKLVPN